MGDDPFADFDTEETASSESEKSTSETGDAAASTSSAGTSPSTGGRRFADELYSEKISAKFRTFFIDLKESSNGKFVKISEKSRGGQKSTIMFDAEDIDSMIEALQKVKEHI